MTILVDIDGVMVTTPAWRKAELLDDGFLKFDEVQYKTLSRSLSRQIHILF